MKREQLIKKIAYEAGISQHAARRALDVALEALGLTEHPRLMRGVEMPSLDKLGLNSSKYWIREPRAVYTVGKLTRRQPVRVQAYGRTSQGSTEDEGGTNDPGPSRMRLDMFKRNK